MEITIIQKRSMGHNYMSFLPQLGNFHPTDLDANILSPGIGNGFDVMWHLFSVTMDNNGYFI